MNIKLFSGIVAFGAVLLTAVFLHNENVPAEKANASLESAQSVSVKTSEIRKVPLSEGRPLRLTVSLLGNSHEELYQKMAELRAAIFAKRDSLGSEKTISIERESIQITQTSDGEGNFRARQNFVVHAPPKQAEALSGAVSELPDVEIEPAIDRSMNISCNAFEEAVNAVSRNALSKAAEYTSTAGNNLDTGRILYAKGTLEYFVSGSNEATVEASLFLKKELLPKSAKRSFSDSKNLAQLEILSRETEKFAADEFKTFFQLELQGADKKALYQQAVKRNAEILRQLRDLGVLDTDVSTGQISLTKNFRYNYQSGKNEFLGYRANQFFEVTTHSKDTAGTVVKSPNQTICRTTEQSLSPKKRHTERPSKSPRKKRSFLPKGLECISEAFFRLTILLNRQPECILERLKHRALSNFQMDTETPPKPLRILSKFPRQHALSLN